MATINREEQELQSLWLLIIGAAGLVRDDVVIAGARLNYGLMVVGCPHVPKKNVSTAMPLLIASVHQLGQFVR